MKSYGGKAIRLPLMHILAICGTAVLLLMGNAMGEISKTGLVGEWHFDESTGNVVKDSSGNGNDGTVYNATFVEGKFGKALSFNGMYDYVQIPSNSALDNQDFTMSSWFYQIGNDSSANTIVDRLWNGNNKDTIADAVSLYTWNQEIYLYYNWNGNADFPSTEYFTSKTKIFNNVWYFICVTKEGPLIRFYINGQLSNELILTKDISPFQNPANWLIGAQIDDGIVDNQFNGLIDEVRIYNRSLGTDEVKANYEAGQIMINSSPSNAEVLIDGQSKGNASPTLTVFGISPGSHAVKCKLTGYSDYDANVVLNASSALSINCEPKKLAPSTPTPTPTPSPTPSPTLTPTSTISTSSNSLTVSVSPELESIGPNQTSTITFTVKGSNGKEIPGASIKLIITGGDKVNPASGITDPFGEFATTFTAPAEGKAVIKALVKKEGFNDSSGEITVEVKTNQTTNINGSGNKGQEDGISPVFIATIVVILILTAVVLFIWTKGNLIIVPKQSSVPGDGKSTVPIKVQFSNAFGKLRRQGNDREIEMETTSGTIQNVVIPAGKESIDAILTSSKESGPATVTARSGNQKAAAQVTFVSNEASLDIEIAPASIPADGKSNATVIIKIKDDKGNLILSLNERTVELNTTLGTVTSPVKIPPKTQAGIATITSGQVTGTARVVASSSSVKGEGKSLYGEGKVVFVELAKRYCMHCGVTMTMDAPNCPACGNIPPSGVDTKQCTTCSAVLPLSAKFCDKCGAKQPM